MDEVYDMDGTDWPRLRYTCNLLPDCRFFYAFPAADDALQHSYHLLLSLKPDEYIEYNVRAQYLEVARDFCHKHSGTFEALQLSLMLGHQAIPGKQNPFSIKSGYLFFECFRHQLQDGCVNQSVIVHGDCSRPLRTVIAPLPQ